MEQIDTVVQFGETLRQLELAEQDTSPRLLPLPKWKLDLSSPWTSWIGAVR